MGFVKYTSSWILGAMLFALLVSVVRAADFATIDVIADADIWQSNVNPIVAETNLGSFGRNDTRVQSWNTPGGPVPTLDRQALVKFDIDMNWLQSLDAWHILSATFQANDWSDVDPPSNPNENIDLVLITEGDWTEFGVTWLSRDGVNSWATPGTPGGTTVVSETWDPNVNWEQDASAMVEMWRIGLPNYGLLLTRSGWDAGGNASFYSKEAAAQAPQLVIEYDLEQPPPSLGDFDVDGDVDGTDLLVWQRGFPGTFEASDLADWENNFGTVPALSTSAAVPEPGSVVLALLAVVAVVGKYRCR